MNININSAATANKSLKANNPQTNISVSNIENINNKNIEIMYNILSKSDKYSGSASNSQINDFSDLFSFVKKILFNDQFREIAINSNPKLKEIYDNFINAITMDDSKLGEYIRSVLNDSGKFSGKFFDALNKILSESNDISLKNSIYEFLKIFDYYFSQNENASGVNSAFNDLLSKLPDDVQKYFLEMLSNNSVGKLNIFFSAIFNMNLPEKEKLKVFLSYMHDLIKNENNFEDDNPTNIFIPTDKIPDKVSKEVIRETIKLADAVIKVLKQQGTELPGDVKAKLNELDNEVGKIISQAPSKDIKDSVDTKLLINLVQNILKNESNNIDNINNTAGMNNINNANNMNSASNIDKSFDDIVNFFQSLKEGASFGDKKIIGNIIDKLLLSAPNSSDILTVFENIKNELLTNNSYPKEIKEQIIFLFDKATSNVLEKLIFGDVSKNKCELLLNVYEKEIMPVLLKNNTLSSMGSLSVLTHNLLRLKLGTANEFNRQVTSFFNQLEYNKVMDKEQVLNMKFALAKKIISKQELGEDMTQFLKLLDNGIKYSSNDLNKASFENTLLSLISKNDTNSLFKYFFIPLLYNGVSVLSEIFLSKEKAAEDSEESKFEEFLNSILKITLIFDIEKKGIFNTTLFYSEGQISAKVIMPDNFDSHYGKISEDISEIIRRNNLIPENILVTK